MGIDRVTSEANGKKADKIGPVIKGITITQYAFQGISVDGTYANGPMEESEMGKEVVGTTLENCEISFCGRVGAWLIGDKLTMRNCKVSDTSTEGVYVNCASDVLLEGNIPGMYLMLSGLLAFLILLAGYWLFKRVEYQFADIV